MHEELVCGKLSEVCVTDSEINLMVVIAGRICAATSLGSAAEHPPYIC